MTPSGPVRVNVGEPINLECQAAGEPRPSVTWHRLDNNRRTIMSSPVPMESNALMQVHIDVAFILFVCQCLWFIADKFYSCASFILQILVARPEDSGTYICTAQNSQGKSETRVEVTVHGGAKVPTAPLAFVQEPLLVVVEGATTVLHCDAHGKYETYTENLYIKNTICNHVMNPVMILIWSAKTSHSSTFSWSK